MFSNSFAKWYTDFSVVSLLVATLSLPMHSTEQPNTTPTIRVNTRLVLVDVVVKDKKGSPVAGLKAEDFTVQERGKTQKIAFLIPPTETTAQSAPSELPPGIYSNRPEYRSPGGPLTVILIDAANTPFKDQAYARQQMLQFVREQSKPGQRMAVMTLTNTLGVLQDFTGDPQVLAKAIEDYKPREQEMPKGASPPVIGNSDSARGNVSVPVTLNQELRAFQSIQLAYVEDRRVETTLSAMRSLARILGGIPGRKSVIWLTAAFPFTLIPENREVTGDELADSLPTISQLGVGTRSAGASASTSRQQHAQEIREAAAQLASAQVAIYPVDVRGLVSGMEPTIDDLAATQLFNATQTAQMKLSDVTSSQETMREMAQETGGKVYINQNEIKQGAVLATQDSAAAYTIGYYPEDKKMDGKYRPIKVKVNRDALEVRNRRGYYAIDPAQSKELTPEQTVAEALRDSVPDTLVTFRAQVKPGDGGKLGVVFLVDADTVSAEDASGGNKKLNVAFYAAAFGVDGKMLGNQSMKVDQAFSAETYQQIQKQGILLQMDVPSPAGATDVRLAVRENRTGSVGSLTIPLNP
jgi:VWFA-related protein